MKRNLSILLKSCYFLLFVLFISGCHKNEEAEYQTINIEKHYPYLMEKHLIEAISEDTLGLFKQQLFQINSIAQLKENSLYLHCPDSLKEDLDSCDFNNYTLIMTSSFYIVEISSLKVSFRYDSYASNYSSALFLYGKSIVEPVENVYLIIDVFCVKKLSENSVVLFTVSLSTK